MDVHWESEHVADHGPHTDAEASLQLDMQMMPNEIGEIAVGAAPQTSPVCHAVASAVS